MLVETFRALLRRSSTLPPDVLRAAYTAAGLHTSPSHATSPKMCRQELAGRADLPVDLLCALAADSSPLVRGTALRNPALPAEVLHRACRTEGDRSVLLAMSGHPSDTAALTLLARRRFPAAVRTRILTELLENCTTPAAAAAHLLLRLDPLLPTDTVDLPYGEDLLVRVDSAVSTRLSEQPALGRELFGQLASMRARFSTALHAPLTDAQMSELVAELVLVPLAAVPAPDLPDHVAHRAVNLLSRDLPAGIRDALIAALAPRNWQHSNYRNMLVPHLSADDADAAGRAAALAARVTACTDPVEIAEIVAAHGVAGLAAEVARALVTNPHTPVELAVQAAAERLRSVDGVRFVASARADDAAFLLGYARACPKNLPLLPGAGQLTRQLLNELTAEVGGEYRVESWAKADGRLGLLSAADRQELSWPTVHALAGVDADFDAWLLELLTPVLQRAGGGELLARVDAEFTGTVASLFALLDGALTGPVPDGPVAAYAA